MVLFGHCTQKKLELLSEQGAGYLARFALYPAEANSKVKLYTASIETRSAIEYYTTPTGITIVHDKTCHGSIDFIDPTNHKLDNIKWIERFQCPKLCMLSH